MQLSKILVEIPSDLKTYTVKDSRGNTLVIREPLAIDYALMDEANNNENLTSQERIFMMAERLAISFNGEAGVTLANIGSLDRVGYKEVMEIILGFQLDIVPDRAESLIQNFLSDQRSELPESSILRNNATPKGFVTR